MTPRWLPRPGRAACPAAPPQEGWDDARLVALAQGDPAAFALLYDRYVGPIYSYCHVRLGSREAAEDATSETFLKAFAALARYRQRSFPAWLFRIAHNVVVDVQRRRVGVTPLDIAQEIPDPRCSPEDLALVAAEREALRRALATLPDDQRLALELQCAGWSGERIAVALERSPTAVRMLHARARARLRALLARDHDDPDVRHAGLTRAAGTRRPAHGDGT